MTYLNITERGPFVVQECKEISKYAIWDRRSREHVGSRGLCEENALYDNEEEAIGIAENLAILQKDAFPFSPVLRFECEELEM